MLLVAIILEVPPRVSNAILHKRIQKISHGMTQDDVSRILGQHAQLTGDNPTNMELIVADRSNPLAFVFPCFWVNDHHVVNIVSGRVESVSTGGYVF